MVLNAIRGTIHSDPDVRVPFDELRRKTLENLKAAADKLRGSSDQMLNKYSFRFKDGEEIMEQTILEFD